MRSMLITCCALLPCAVHAADSSGGHADLVFGFRAVEDSYDEATFGIAATLRPNGPWTLNASLLYGVGSGDFFDGIDIATQDTNTLEFALGGGYEWHLADGFTPSMAVGLSLVQTEIEYDAYDFKEDDAGLGVWYEVGAAYRAESYIIGVHLRYTSAELEIADTTVNGGGFLPSIRIGWNF